MVGWLDFLLDATSLKAIYGEEIPSLNGVDFHGIDLHRDGPTALLKFDLPTYPKQPPKKWMAAGFNRVQLRLLAVGVRDFKMTGLMSNCRLDISLIKEGVFVRLQAVGARVSIDLIAEHLLVDGVSSYREEAE